MNRKKIQFLLISVVFFLGSFAQLCAADILSGRVYKGDSGTEPPAATALSGVTITLYGSNNAGTMGISIGTTTTNSEGWFGLTATIGYEYYTLVESDPSGYHSVGASSVGGTVLNNNQIRFSTISAPLSGQTLTGNKFWDKADTPDNNPPVADANGPYTGMVGQAITLDGSGSYDPDPGDMIASYKWDLDDDGQYDDATGIYSQHTWKSAYNGNIGLRVTDSHGGSDTDQTSITISRGEPEIDVRGNGISISNGDNTPSHADWTVIGSTEIKTSYISKTFYIHNTGSDTLFISGYSLNPDTRYQSGSIAASFGLIPGPMKVPPGSSIPIGIEFMPHQTGTWGTTLTIDNNDSDEDPFTFDVQGTGTKSTSPQYDYGDAPDPTYPTLLSNNGARHLIKAGFYMGTGVDGESDGLPSGLADGDNIDGYNDEDGVSISPFIAPGQAVPLTIVASDTGVVNAWLDFNTDGDWADAGEHFMAAQAVVPGANSFTLNVPGGAMPGLTFARFRFSSMRQVGYDGLAPDGEVEDYALEIVDGDDGSVTIVKEATPEDSTTFWFCTQLSSGFFSLYCDFLQDPIKDKMTILNPDKVMNITESSVPDWTLTDITVSGDTDNGSIIDIANRMVDLDYDAGEHIVITFKNQKTGIDEHFDFGDAPDPTYPTLLASNGARHKISPYLYLGSSIDPEPEGQASAKADGDDHNTNHPGAPFPPGDEDGVLLPSVISAGQPFSIQVTSSGKGVLNAWLDFNIDGDWADAGEHIIAALPLSPGMNSFSVTAPGNAQAGQSFARFRLSSVRDISYDGPAPDGEVEDYEVFIDEGGEAPPLKWKQAPLMTEDPDYPFAPCFMGWDEYSVYTERIVADDWFCSDPRPVTDIHWWGSYIAWDDVAAPEHAPHEFHIGVWTDTPPTDHMPWRHPGELVWEWHVPRELLNERPVGADFVTGRMEKPDTCFQYDFYIPEDQWFFQDGDSSIYWLSIAAVYEVVPDSFVWGWKTREHYFHGDAVRITEPKVFGMGTAVAFAEPVDEMWDLSFVLTTNEHATEFDFGDAPESRYPTLYGQNGAHHIFNPDVFLGAGVDPETDGQPEQASMGDDHDGYDDEDGIIFLSALKPGSPVSVEVDASTSGFLNAWMDFNNNGSWADPDEQIFVDQALVPGTNALTFIMPSSSDDGATFSRFRFSREAGIPFFGLAMDGEVEDYHGDVSPVGDHVGKEPDIIEFSLMQNFPNPFHSHTEILYEIPMEVFVRLTIYDLSGKEVAVLVNEQQSSGRHMAKWDGKDHQGLEAAEGVYFYRFEAGKFQETRKLVHLK